MLICLTLVYNRIDYFNRKGLLFFLCKQLMMETSVKKHTGLKTPITSIGS